MAVTIAVQPAQDPAYLAFLRASGVEESELSGEAALRISSLQRGLERRLPVYADKETRGLETTANAHEDRGLYRSGARLIAQQRLSDDVSRERLEDQAQTTDAIAGTNQGLASDIARLRRAQTEQELATRSSLGSL